MLEYHVYYSDSQTKPEKWTLQDNNVQQIITIPIFSNHIQLAAQSGMGRNVRIERITHVWFSKSGSTWNTRPLITNKCTQIDK